MTSKLSTPETKNGHNWVFWLTIFAIFCLAVYALKSVLMPFIVGILIGYLLNPFTAKFEKFGLNRTIATLLVLSIILLISIPAIIILFTVINEQLMRFTASIPDYITTLTAKIDPFLQNLQKDFPSISADKIKEGLKEEAANNLKILSNILKKLISGSFAIINILSLLLITPIVAFYMLRDWRPFVIRVDNLLPRQSKTTIRGIAKDIDKTIAGFLRGQISVCLILGAFYSICLHFIGLELGILVGFLAGIISFIPYVGAITGLIISLLIAFAQFDNYTPIIQVAIVFGIGQFLEGNFLTPKFIGENVGLHPVWVIFALLAGGALLGFLGLLIAIPVAAIIGVLIRHAINNYKKSSLYRG